METFKGPAPTSLQTKINVRGLALSNLSAPGATTNSSGFLSVTNGGKTEVYQIKEVSYSKSSVQ